MRPTRALLLATLVAAASAAALAAKGTVAVLPASVASGAAGNGPVLTEALRASLEKQGYTLLPEQQVVDALKAQKLDSTKILPLTAVRAVRDATKADYVVYPRILAVGQGAVAGHPQATLLVNVLGKTGGSYLHTKQVAQPFAAEGEPATAVISRADADQAVARLMEAFYTPPR
ncbi:MAG TPA: hypothetical protein VFU47_17740 [Armatimonadota bacterium]|nr:hypothetical protein [Armatimonadota bacterium]